jgi:hypothetical protein
MYAYKHPLCILKIAQKCYLQLLNRYIGLKALFQYLIGWFFRHCSALALCVDLSTTNSLLFLPFGGYDGIDVYKRLLCVKCDFLSFLCLIGVEFPLLADQLR